MIRAPDPTLIECVRHGIGSYRPDWRCPKCSSPSPEQRAGVEAGTSRNVAGGCESRGGGQPRPGQQHEDALAAALIAARLDVIDVPTWMLYAEEECVGACVVRQYPWGLRCGRRFRSDFAAPTQKLLIEVAGMAHAAGRTKVRKDIERDGLAAALGYRVLKVTPEQVRDGTAVQLVIAALARPAKGGGAS